MTDFWRHVGKGLFIFPLILALSGVLHLEIGVSLQIFVLGTFSLLVTYIQGLMFPDLDLETSIPYKSRDLLFVPQASILGFLSIYALDIPISLKEPLSLFMPVFVWYILLIIIFQYLFNNSISGHRGETHYVSTFLLVAALNSALGLGFSFYPLGFELYSAVIIGANSGAGFFIGAIIHRILD